MSEDPPPPRKLPFRRLQRPLEQLTEVALPFHTQLLGQQGAALERLKEGGGGQLRLEQTRACKTVQLLKADLFELEQLNLQVREEDQDAFHHKVQLPLKNAVETLSNFMSLHSDVLGPCLSMESDSLSSAPADFPGIVCDPNAPPPEEEGLTQLQLQQEPGEQQQQKPEHQASGAWSRLRSELLEIHSLVLKFSTLVFAQQGPIDTVQDNVQQTAANVQEGTEHLRKASLLRAATFPVVGALVGGLLLGPVGAVAGLKLAGCAACAAGGTALGYTAGSKLKQRHQAGLQAITYPARTKSESDLSTVTDKS